MGSPKTIYRPAVDKAVRKREKEAVLKVVKQILLKSCAIDRRRRAMHVN